MMSDGQIIEIIGEQYPKVQIGFDSSRPLESFEQIASYAQQLLERNAQPEFKFLCAFLNQLYYIAAENAKTGIDGIFLEKVSHFILIQNDPDHIWSLLPTRMRMLVQDQYAEKGSVGQSYVG